MSLHQDCDADAVERIPPIRAAIEARLTIVNQFLPMLIQIHQNCERLMMRSSINSSGITPEQIVHFGQSVTSFHPSRSNNRVSFNRFQRLRGFWDRKESSLPALRHPAHLIAIQARPCKNQVSHSSKILLGWKTCFDFMPIWNEVR